MNVLKAARALFLSDGYTSTTVAQIAKRAGVSIDTVYAAIGPKPTVLRLLVESMISGTDEMVPAQERDYVRRIQAIPCAHEKLVIYAGAIREINERLAPVYLALREAAGADEECAALWHEVSERRAHSMHLFADELIATGQLRSDVEAGELGDVIWVMGGAEYYVLLINERGWAPERFETWFVEALERLFFAPPGQHGPTAP